MTPTPEGQLTSSEIWVPEQEDKPEEKKDDSANQDRPS